MTASGVTARYAYDFADRQQSLTAERAGLPDQPLVTGAAYAPSGPLKSLALGNGVAETRAHTTRYFPDRITAATTAALLDWAYTTDAVGNPTLIDDLLDANPANDRLYNYQDFHYFLTQGDGPWGQLSWSYDKIGNRLSETRDTVLDSYTYQPGTGGNTALLNQIQLGAGGTRSYTYGLAGHLEQIDAAGNLLTYTHDDAGRLARIARPAGSVEANQLYDGRGFLISAAEKPFDQLFVNGFEEGDAGCWDIVVGGDPGIATCLTGPTVTAAYSSEGLLQQLDTQSTLATPAVAKTLFHFAGRPVATRALPTGGTETWQYLTTDHLGTPILATDETGLQLWQGGFEPFGQDYAGAQTAGVFLRFPGQWDDEAWSSASLGAEGYYNVHRWYEHGTGRYGRADPLGLYDGPNVYAYAAGNPILQSDPLGLAILLCSRNSFLPVVGGAANHAYFWDPRPERQAPRSCGRGPYSKQEKGPLYDECKIVPGSDGKEGTLMLCCEHIRRFEPFIPFANDCQAALAACTEALGLGRPNPPGGRFGRPCDQCPAAPSAKPPVFLPPGEGIFPP